MSGGAKNKAVTDTGAETNIGDSLHGDWHHGGGYSYPLVDPRLEEVHNYGTTVQSTGAEHRCRAFPSTTPRRDE